MNLPRCNSIVHRGNGKAASVVSARRVGSDDSPRTLRSEGPPVSTRRARDMGGFAATFGEMKELERKDQDVLGGRIVPYRKKPSGTAGPLQGLDAADRIESNVFGSATTGSEHRNLRSMCDALEWKLIP